MEAKQYATKQPMGHWRNQRGNKKYLETNGNRNENGNTAIQNQWDIAKAVLKGKFTVLEVYCMNKEKSQINNLN